MFGGVIRELVAAVFEADAGGELNGNISIMSALHSSSALTVNLFRYWVVNDDASMLARLVKVPSQNISGA